MEDPGPATGLIALGVVLRSLDVPDAQFARLSGVTRQFWFDVKRGHVRVSPRLWRDGGLALSQILGVDDEDTLDALRWTFLGPRPTPTKTTSILQRRLAEAMS